MAPGAVEEWFSWWLADWGMDVHLTDVTQGLSAVNLAGPRAREILSQLTELDCGPEAFTYLDAKRAAIAGVQCLILRIGFVGELGYEIHFPSAYGEHVWDALIGAGEEFGIRPFGLEPQRILRLQKMHILIGQDTDSESTPYGAAMPWIVKLDKEEDFIGRWALEHYANETPAVSLVGFTTANGHVPTEGAVVVDTQRRAGRAGDQCPTLAGALSGDRPGLGAESDGRATAPRSRSPTRARPSAPRSRPSRSTTRRRRCCAHEPGLPQAGCRSSRRRRRHRRHRRRPGRPQPDGGQRQGRRRDVSGSRMAGTWPSGYTTSEQEAEFCASTVGWADVSHLGKLELQADAGDDAQHRGRGGRRREPRARSARPELPGAWWLPLTASRTLIVCESGDATGLQQRLEQAIAAERRRTPSVADVSSVFAALTLVGPLAREVFARFCAVDLRPAVTPVAALRPGSIARQPGLIVREDEDRFLFLFGWAVGEYMWTVVEDAARHLGGGPVGLDALAAITQPRRRAPVLDIFRKRRMWRRQPELKGSYDVVIIGGGSHGLATAYYLQKEHGIKNVAILEKRYIGSGASGRNTTILRSNYKTPEGRSLLRRQRQALRGPVSRSELQPAVLASAVT